MNNCFSIIFKGECEKLKENLAKHEKQMSFGLAIMPRNPIITVRGDHNAELLYSPLKIILVIANILQFIVMKRFSVDDHRSSLKLPADPFNELRSFPGIRCFIT